MDISNILYGALRQNGMSHNAAIGALANASAESSLNPLASNGSHTGLWQWDNQDRLPKLIAQGMQLNDPTSQAQYLIKEMGPDVLNQLNNAPSPEDATQLFEQLIERSGGQAMDSRYAAAKDFANKYGAMAPTFDNAKFNISNPNEPLDVGALMDIGAKVLSNQPTNSINAMQEQLGLQAYHDSFAPNVAAGFKPLDQQLMQMALKKGQMEDEQAQKGANLTAAGRLAQMIANSGSANNAQQYAAFAKMLGLNLDAGLNRFVTPNELAMYKQRRDDEISMQNMKFQQQMAAMAMRPTAGAYGGGRARGSGGSSGGFNTEGLGDNDVSRDVNTSLQREYGNATGATPTQNANILTLKDKFDATMGQIAKGINDGDLTKKEMKDFQSTGGGLPYLDNQVAPLMNEAEKYAGTVQGRELLAHMTNAVQYVKGNVAKNWSPASGNTYHPNNSREED